MLCLLIFMYISTKQLQGLNIKELALYMTSLYHCRCADLIWEKDRAGVLPLLAAAKFGQKSKDNIIESVDSICRDSTDNPSLHLF